MKRKVLPCVMALTMVAPVISTAPQGYAAVAQGDHVETSTIKKEDKVVCKFDSQLSFTGVGDKTIEVAEAFDAKEGFKAQHETEGELTDEVTISGKVDTGKPGRYKVKYSLKVEDKKFEQVRVITVVAPVVTEPVPEIVTAPDVVADEPEVMLAEAEEVKPAELPNAEGVQEESNKVNPDLAPALSLEISDFTVLVKSDLLAQVKDRLVIKDYPLSGGGPEGDRFAVRCWLCQCWHIYHDFYQEYRPIT